MNISVGAALAGQSSTIHGLQRTPRGDRDGSGGTRGHESLALESRAITRPRRHAPRRDLAASPRGTRPSNRRMALAALVSQKPREGGGDDEFLQSVAAALVTAIGQQAEEELKAEEELESDEMEEKDEEEEQRQAEGGLECGGDVPGHEGTTEGRPRNDDSSKALDEQPLRKDAVDALPWVLVEAEAMLDKKGHPKESATLSQVRIDLLLPPFKRHEGGQSQSRFYGEDDSAIASVRLVREGNKCTLFKLGTDEGKDTELGSFRAGHLTKLQRGFEVKLKPSKKKKKKKKRDKRFSVVLTVPPDEQHKYIAIFSKHIISVGLKELRCSLYLMSRGLEGYRTLGYREQEFA
ncbi:uncharacterized protein LOC122245801 [Penaeus japonicus]|uniref:uncharacterized protein LOC122245801 n=1 Tax=Penaeus japonicus TaxID=27405 RepID=UPI001C710587|nr:uncharacterized protein LOC122245801 [Penaeus japonicus]